MKTDTIFYSLFQLFPELLFDLLGEDSTQASKYEFSSREIKELTCRFDGIMIPDSSEFTDLLYFVEVQFQANEDFYWGLFNEIFAYAGQSSPLMTGEQYLSLPPVVWNQNYPTFIGN